MNAAELKSLTVNEIVARFASVEAFVRAAETASADIDDEGEYVAFAHWIRTRAADAAPAFNAKARLADARAAWEAAQADASNDEVANGRRFVTAAKMKAAAMDLHTFTR